jgi:hypothetical protein
MMGGIYAREPVKLNPAKFPPSNKEYEPFILGPTFARALGLNTTLVLSTSACSCVCAGEAKFQGQKRPHCFMRPSNF